MVDTGTDMAWTEAELVALARAMIEDNDVTLGTTVEIAGVRFYITWLDQGETEHASKEVGKDDILTRELTWRREILRRAIRRVNDRPVTPETITRFLSAAPPQLVEMLYSDFVAVRSDQALKLHRLTKIAKE